MKNTKLLALVLSGVFLTFQLVPLALAQSSSSSVTVSHSSTAGSTIALGAAIKGALSDVTVQATSTGTTPSTGTISLTPTDQRGSGAGWAVQLTSSNLGVTGANINGRVLDVSGSGSAGASLLTFSGRYAGNNYASAFHSASSVPSGYFTIDVAAETSNVPSGLSITAPDGSAYSVTASSGAFNVVLDGILTGAFTGAGHANDYIAGDKFRIAVDAMPYNRLHVTTGVITTTGNGGTDSTVLSDDRAAGGAVGVYLSGQTDGATGATGTTSNARVEWSTDTNEGLGDYYYEDALSWETHPNHLSGAYQAVLSYLMY